jgi:hypothetical protein
MRFTPFGTFLILLTLSACGGGDGGVSSAKVDNNVDNLIKEDPLKSYIEIESSYQGNKTQAYLNQNNLTKFYEYLFFIVPELLPEYVDETDTGFGQSCTGGGEAIIGELIDNKEVHINFKNCVEDGSKINGQVTARIDKFSSGGEVIASTFIFEDVDFSTEFANGKLKGTMSVADLELGCPTSETIYDLLISEGSGDQIYFSDFYIYRRGDVGVLCGDDGIRGSGSIHDSELGYVEFKITEDFKLKNMTYNDLEQGTFELKGSDDSTAIFSINNYLENGYNDSYYKLELQSSAEESFEYVYINDYFSSQFLLSFKDSDDDGISDVLENYLGFNLNDSADAALDSDSDGYSNIDEIIYFGHPLNAQIKPNIADVSVELSHETKGYSLATPIDIFIANHSDDFNPSGVELIVSAEAPFTFTEENINIYSECLLLASNTKISCKLTEQLISLHTYSFYLEADKTYIEKISANVKAEISFVGYDPISSNNVKTIGITRNELKVDYSIWEANRRDSYAMVSGSYKEFQYGIQPVGSSLDENGERTTFDLFRDDLKINLIVPPLGQLSNVSCYQNDSQEWSDCLEGTTLKLDPDSLNFKFTFTGDNIGKDFLIIQVKSELTGESVLKEWKLPIIVGESAKLIQDQINVASEGDVIDVAKGVYLGPLDLSAKNVTLQAESPDTILAFIFDETYFDGPTMKLANGSSVIGFNIASHLINIGETGGNFAKNHFGIAEHYLWGASIESAGNFNFDQNVITAIGAERVFDHSVADYKLGCVSIGIVNSVKAANTTIISNNLYKGNKFFHSDISYPCDFVNFYGGTLHMKNNTFIGMGEPLKVIASHQYNVADYQLLYSNNITVDSRRMIYNEIVQAHFHFGYTFSSHVQNNLVHNMFLDVWDPEGLINETGTIVSNPLFNSDFSLSSNSPAIDAGLDNGVLVDLFNQSRPVDGNGDGQARHDIGAFEFID